jgi:signal transduction histidine kinase
LRITPIALIGQPMAHLAAPIWIAEATRGRDSPLNSMMTFRLMGELSFSEIDLPHTSDTGDREFFQINAQWSSPWYSKSLGEMQLPYNPDQFVNKDLYTAAFDDVPLAAELRVRRVQLKVPATRFTLRPVRTSSGPARGTPQPPRAETAVQVAPLGQSPTPPRSGTQPPRTDPPPASRDRTDPNVPWVPWIVIHCAADVAKREAAVADLRTDLTRKLDNERVAAKDELARLRQRLLLICLGAFVATTLGGFALVGIGLAPLKRLSEAVSRVSPRDFKLPLADDAALGAELSPIADRLRETLDQLRRVYEREKQAAADISHELRTPVASLLTTLEVALRKPRSAEEYKQTLVECRTVGQQMRQLVERLMALARLDAGSDQVRPSNVDVAELVGEVTALVKPLAGERGLQLRVECPAEVTWKTDPDKLREILVNLLHNAIQYNRPNGTIDVSAEATGRWLDLQVRDTGIGIPDGTSERIFERFYRADPARNGSGLHAGLGLSIVKGYVGLLGGTITVESKAGQGSTFRVRLPATLAA